MSENCALCRWNCVNEIVATRCALTAAEDRYSHVQHSELTGVAPEEKVTKTLTDMFISLRGSLEPTNIQVCRLYTVNVLLESCPNQLKLTCPVRTPTEGVDMHSESGYRRLIGDADEEDKR
eukprot:8532842-Pyramimonas_sp.AAC.1